MSLVLQVVRFYWHVICPVCIVKYSARAAWNQGFLPCAAGCRGGGKVEILLLDFHFSTAHIRVLLLCSLAASRPGRRRRGGKVGISRLLRDFQGSVGAGENLLSVFAGFHAPVFSTALRFRFDVQRLAVAAVPSHQMRAEANRDGPVQVLMDGDCLFCQAIPPARLLDLPPAFSDPGG